MSHLSTETCDPDNPRPASPVDINMANISFCIGDFFSVAVPLGLLFNHYYSRRNYSIGVSRLQNVVAQVAINKSAQYKYWRIFAKNLRQPLRTRSLSL